MARGLFCAPERTSVNMEKGFRGHPTKTSLLILQIHIIYIISRDNQNKNIKTKNNFFNQLFY